LRTTQPHAIAPGGLRLTRPLEGGGYELAKCGSFSFNDRKSWDSRYFGAIPAGIVRGRLVPILRGDVDK
jgi:type IV secretory pathway protease TraF